MTETEQALARELARHPKWKWGRGMLAIWGNRLERVVLTADDGRGLLCGTDATSPEHYPDLSDPATQGCILSMIGDVKIDALDPWVQWRNADGSFSSTYSDTLGEALARAWLAVNGGKR